ncbi:MAG: beta-glucuronidase [Ignavibacteriales bacterium]|nr:beta-glucuronidase [Ignavibacteriales bacterium]
MKSITFLFFIISFITGNAVTENNLITNIDGRKNISLNGKWNIIIDPYENGYYNYRYQPREDGYFENRKPKDKSELIEYDFDKSEQLNVPGDWNTQMEKLFLYEGTIWYKKSFQYNKQYDKRVFIYFGAVNYDAVVYVNGKKVGEHEGGFTPFNFEITDELASNENFIIVKVDNKRKREGVPTLNTDWWNYGGITRDVKLVEVPVTFIKDYFIQLKKGSLNEVSGWIRIDGLEKEQEINIQIEDAGIKQKIHSDKNGYASFNFITNLKLWSPENPFLYNVKIISAKDTVVDKIGFRSIETKGEDIFLNGKPIFLCGISIHEEAPYRSGRAFSKEDAVTLLSWAKELGCNYVRLAHYPHNENMIREADKMGMMVWAEIPVYWTIMWSDSNTYNNASNQLNEMITRDKNRAAIILWSVANETPKGEARLKFLTGLINEARQIDSTRLITAATETHSEKNTIIIDDPLSNYLDVIGVNEYIGWYWGKPEDAVLMKWKSEFNKPFIISEFGGDALYNNHGYEKTRWTEEYQESIYLSQIKMLKGISFLRGVSPWILMDFRSPRRHLPGIQDFWNRKGLISERGNKKKAFYVLQKYYMEIEKGK